MSPRVRTFLFQIGSFAVGGVLLYFALRDVDFGQVGDVLRQADYRWLAPLVLVVLLSHLLRAWRWQMLLDTLPEAVADGQPHRVSLKHAFYSVMIGYMVNYAAPRLGEVARSANMATHSGLPFTGVLGTVVVERILDVAVLLLALLSVGVLLTDRSDVLHALFLEPLLRWLREVPVFWLVAAGVIAMTALSALLVYGYLAFRSPVLRGGRLHALVVSFRAGLLTLFRTRRPGVVIASTVGMWGCYLVMAHLPFLLLRMDGPFDLSMVDTWSIMNLGALGIVIPSPGGTGTYHYITIQVLEKLFAVDREPAATYAMLTHAAQLVLYTLTGFVCLSLQGNSLGTLRRTTRQARAGAEPAGTAAPEMHPADEREAPTR